MKEDQHTEFKRLWKDEFFREICAFAIGIAPTIDKKLSA